MDKNKSSYIFIYSIILVVVVAGALSLVAVLLQPKQRKNFEIEQKRNILSALKVNVETDEVEKTYEKMITEIFVNEAGETTDGANENAHIIYIAKTNEGEKFVFPLRGKGLWGPIWGYLSLNDDFNTVYGAYFDHKSETSGLGAEIATDWFQAQFSGKQIFNAENQFVSVKTNKHGASNNNEVNAVSGATITSTSVSTMIEDCLKTYLPYIEKSRR